MKHIAKILTTSVAALLMLGASVTLTTTLTGCEQKEKILDVETPGGEIEVERTKDSGKVEVEVND